MHMTSGYGIGHTLNLVYSHISHYFAEEILLFIGQSAAKFIVPDWGDKVNSAWHKDSNGK